MFLSAIFLCQNSKAKPNIRIYQAKLLWHVFISKNAMQLLSQPWSHLEFHSFCFEKHKLKVKLSKQASFKVFLYLCGGLQQQQRPPLPLGVLSHPWQPAGPLEPPTGPEVQTLRRAPGRDGAVLMGVGPLADPGHAGRGAGPGAAAVGSNRRDRKRKERRQKTERFGWPKCIGGSGPPGSDQ